LAAKPDDPTGRFFHVCTLFANAWFSADRRFRAARLGQCDADVAQVLDRSGIRMLESQVAANLPIQHAKEGSTATAGGPFPELPV